VYISLAKVDQSYLLNNCAFTNGGNCSRRWRALCRENMDLCSFLKSL